MQKAQQHHRLFIPAIEEVCLVVTLGVATDTCNRVPFGACSTQIHEGGADRVTVALPRASAGALDELKKSIVGRYRSLVPFRTSVASAEAWSLWAIGLVRNSGALIAHSFETLSFDTHTPIAHACGNTPCYQDHIRYPNQIPLSCLWCPLRGSPPLGQSSPDEPVSAT